MEHGSGNVGKEGEMQNTSGWCHFRKSVSTSEVVAHKTVRPCHTCMPHRHTHTYTFTPIPIWRLKNPRSPHWQVYIYTSWADSRVSSKSSCRTALSRPLLPLPFHLPKHTHNAHIQCTYTSKARTRNKKTDHPARHTRRVFCVVLRFSAAVTLASVVRQRLEGTPTTESTALQVALPTLSRHSKSRRGCSRFSNGEGLHQLRQPVLRAARWQRRAHEGKPIDRARPLVRCTCALCPIQGIFSILSPRW